VSTIKTKTIDGHDVHTYELKNANGTTIQLTNYGAIVTKMLVADKDGNFENIVLGFDSVGKYKQKATVYSRSHKQP